MVNSVSVRRMLVKTGAQGIIAGCSRDELKKGLWGRWDRNIIHSWLGSWEHTGLSESPSVCRFFFLNKTPQKPEG